MPKLNLVAALLALGLLGACGDSKGACAQLADKCSMCGDFERQICEDVASDNDEEECSFLLDDPCL